MAGVAGFTRLSVRCWENFFLSVYFRVKEGFYCQKGKWQLEEAQATLGSPHLVCVYVCVIPFTPEWDLHELMHRQSFQILEALLG